MALRAREIRTSGPEVLGPLPEAKELAGEAAGARHEVLEGLRVELYAISSIIADATVVRARGDRPSHPPYGLVRSMYSETKMLSASPEPVSEGAIDSFETLGKAYLDTMVFHLDRQFQDPGPDERWIPGRLEALLSLFRIDAGPATRSRLRDGFSFVYGGLHFGTGVCVQLAEVMARLLEGTPEVTAGAKAAVMARSVRPAYRLAAMNIDHVVVAYQELQSPAPESAGWMDGSRFAVQESGGAPWRIDFADDDLTGGRRVTPMYSTQGCPARVSPTGGASAIATLWSWCVQLAHDTGLLGATSGRLEDRAPDDEVSAGGG